MQTDVVHVDEVMVRLDCSKSMAYQIIKTLNQELKKKGYITIAGRVPRIAVQTTRGCYPKTRQIGGLLRAKGSPIFC